MEQFNGYEYEVEWFPDEGAPREDYERQLPAVIDGIEAFASTDPDCDREHVENYLDSHGIRHCACSIKFGAARRA